MQYTSTRNTGLHIPAHQAVLQGLSREGGLFVPEEFPGPISPSDILHDSYQQLAVRILSGFLSDYTEDEIRQCVSAAYDSKFDTDAIVPTRTLKDGTLLELFHGPTSAFKDVALTLLPHLLSCAYEKDGLSDTISILTATSGDTGKAALSGFADVPHTAITVFYPEIGVSFIQKKQMQTARGNNVSVIAVQGNFDDCQRMVKEAVSDPEVLKACHHVRISSANSINIGRLLPQVVYYFSAYRDLVNSQKIHCGDEISFIVPTGNFGDILAGYYAKKIGLPIRHLICASNTNHVLTDFLNTGVYSTDRPFVPTMSPSMDILISSNLERLLFMASGNDPELVSKLMDDLKQTGRFAVPEEMMQKIRETFIGYWADETSCSSEIHRLYEQEQVTIDPHTAVAMHALHEYQKTGASEACVVLSTASPFKFSASVLDALSGPSDLKDFAAMNQLSRVTGLKIPAGLAELEQLPIRFSRTIAKADGLNAIKERMEELSHD
ncbi:MAG: threonine synthase [Solobacterium sp.]|jgi:threonine synthase|nr:threonine synthase [Solobacterium sp.]MCH4222568.1 threonine synthase [Solobacterium sp.]MCH4265403.1 threonine synthase [Solobacterium sp.]